MKAEFILMGCSVSSGVPAIGNDWGDCDPTEPKNRRERPCAVVRTDSTTIVIDTGPDFRKQMNDLDIGAIDAVLYTHAHSDHIQGIDELRVLSGRKRGLIDIYANGETMESLRHRFDYMFEHTLHYKKVLEPHLIADDSYGAPLRIGDIGFVPFYQDHGDCSCVGYRFGSVGYSADMLTIGEESIATLRGVDVWLVDGAGYLMEDHRTHAPLSRVIALNEQVGARKVYITGLSKFMDYETLRRMLPPGFEPAYDGLRLPVIL